MLDFIHQKKKGDSRTDLVWTGPETSKLAVRRIDQVLYDLVSNAQEKILLVTFAAARIHRLKKALIQAVERGVKIRLILESATDSASQLSKSAYKAFLGGLEKFIEIYHWPFDRRKKNSLNRPAKLHAKIRRHK